MRACVRMCSYVYACMLVHVCTFECMPWRVLHVICCSCALQHGGQFSANGSGRGNDVTGVSVTCALICVSIGSCRR